MNDKYNVFIWQLTKFGGTINIVMLVKQMSIWYRVLDVSLDFLNFISSRLFRN